MKSIVGKWKIIEMSTWDKDYIDMIQPGCVEFENDGMGRLIFGAVFADLDYRISESSQSDMIEFSFSGDDDGEPISGRAKLTLKDDRLTGRIFIHCGDESEIILER